MAWRPLDGDRAKAPAPARKRALLGLVDSGVPVGILGYLDEEPVAWCSVAPRSTHLELGGPGRDDDVWSITCFFVLRDFRGAGLMKRLLGAAVETARARGARVVEAYPVDPDSPSYRFMGFVPAFEERGFIEDRRVGTRRHVMRLVLD